MYRAAPFCLFVSTHRQTLTWQILPIEGDEEQPRLVFVFARSHESPWFSAPSRKRFVSTAIGLRRCGGQQMPQPDIPPPQMMNRTVHATPRVTATATASTTETGTGIGIETGIEIGVETRTEAGEETGIITTTTIGPVPGQGRGRRAHAPTPGTVIEGSVA